MTDPSHSSYGSYGAKGIRLHRSWRRFEAFLEWATSAGYRPGAWLCRIDGRKGFTPANCIWRSGEVARRHLNAELPEAPPRWLVEAFGEVKGVTAWSRDRRCSVSLAILLRRLRGGWEPEAAIRSPPTRVGRRPVIRVTAFGERKSIPAWAKDQRCRVQEMTLRARLARGIPAEAAITAPRFELDPDLPRHPPRRRSR